jgi:serine/threonine protein kinase
MDTFEEEDWPKNAEKMYERIEVLGKGSFGLVWMCQRKTKPEDDLDDEYVAVKNIEIKEEKGKVYAQREISILTELKHPNVIRLIRAFPVYNDISRLVSLQLARGPNLQRVVSKRGALGLPLCRLISRELVAAVSYLHGRGVLHRDIKPTNLILENTEIRPVEYYDYSHDNSIWSDGEDADEMIKRGKWKVMLVDFGFARALEASEVYLDDYNKNDNNKVKEAPPVGAKKKKRHLRNSITLESQHPNPVPQRDVSIKSLPGDDDELGDIALIERAANALRQNTEDPSITGPAQRRTSNVSNLEGISETRVTIATTVPSIENNNGNRRASITQQKVRSMSALGTKAYAAPEIKHQLRNKTTADLEKTNAALTECVADYGMIVDAYSVGWTLRVILTGVPPNQTISKYMRKYDGQEPSAEMFDEVVCCCPFFFGGGGGSEDDGKTDNDDKSNKSKEKPNFRVRDTDEMPKEATLFISSLTKKDPEERMSIRQAQLHPWIRGDEEPPYVVPQGDYPSHHGDPVVPLKCAGELTRVTENHHL